MRRVPVDSSMIAAVGYGGDEGDTLEVEFKNGTVYQYYGVPQEKVDGMLTAYSIGKYFNAEIKEEHTWEKVA